jgi:hypothetical protein
MLEGSTLKVQVAIHSPHNFTEGITSGAQVVAGADNYATSRNLRKIHNVKQLLRNVTTCNIIVVIPMQCFVAAGNNWRCGLGVINVH